MKGRVRRWVRWREDRGGERLRGLVQVIRDRGEGGRRRGGG